MKRVEEFNLKEVKLRKGKREDIDQIWELEVESRIYHKKLRKMLSKMNNSGITLRFKKKWEKNFSSSFSKRNEVVFVAELNKKIVGYIIGNIFIWQWSDSPPRVGQINDIAVLRKYHRKNIGKILMKEFEKWAKVKKAYALALNVDSNNFSAIELYKINKFRNLCTYMIKKIK